MRLTSDVTYVETVSDEAGRYSLSFIEEGYCPELLFWITGSAEGYGEGRVTKRRVEHGSAPAGATHIRCTEELQVINLGLEREQDELPLGVALSDGVAWMDAADSLDMET
jgi:hypothetical protein